MISQSSQLLQVHRIESLRYYRLVVFTGYAIFNEPFSGVEYFLSHDLISLFLQCWTQNLTLHDLIKLSLARLILNYIANRGLNEIDSKSVIFAFEVEQDVLLTLLPENILDLLDVFLLANGLVEFICHPL